MQLNRKDRLTSVVRNSRSNMDRSANTLPEAFDRTSRLNASVERENVGSPDYSQTRPKING